MRPSSNNFRVEGGMKSRSVEITDFCRKVFSGCGFVGLDFPLYLPPLKEDIRYGSSQISVEAHSFR